MRASKEFRLVERRISELRKNLLPKRFSKLGNYSDQALDQARAYKLLVHAEIEFFIEGLATKTIISALKEWKVYRKTKISLFSLIASYHSSWNVNGDAANNEQIIQLAKSRKNIKENIDEVIDLAQNQFSALIKDNHGIRENNLKTLLLPIGVDFSEIDNTWIADLDSFAKERGAIAHSSKALIGSINPQDEYKKVQSILAGLRKLDLKVQKLL